MQEGLFKLLPWRKEADILRSGVAEGTVSFPVFERGKRQPLCCSYCGTRRRLTSWEVHREPHPTHSYLLQVP